MERFRDLPAETDSLCFSAVSEVFLSLLERQREETRRNGERDRAQSGGGWQGVSESAVSAKRVGFCLARNRRHPKRPSEPRPSGVHPEKDAVGEMRSRLVN